MGRQNPVKKRGRAQWKPQLAAEQTRTVAGHQLFSYDGGKTWTGSRRVLAPIEERRGR